MDVSPADPRPPTLDVLDVLEMIPLDVVESSIWRTLKWPDHAGRSLRQASRRSRRLVDELVTSASYSLWGNGSRSLTLVKSQEAVRDSSIERWAAFVARLPRLTSILLSQTSGSLRQQQPIRDAPLIAAIVQSGVATQGRVQVLKLECHALPLTLACTARLAYPGLEELRVLPRHTLDKSLRAVRLDCRPWHDSALRKVVVGGWGIPDTDTVVSICGLSRLQHLEMTVTHLPDLHHLTCLTNLQHLSLRSTHGHPDIPVGHVACLFTLTRLTHLGLLLGLHIADDPEPTAAPGVSCTMLSQLGQLRSLTLCQDYVVRDSLFAGLALLSLTALSLDRVELSGWRGGHLPLLQRLTTGGLRPTDMLQVLMPLLPLPSLTHLTACFESAILMFDAEWCGAALDVSTSDSSDAMAQAGALKVVAQHQAAAPRLHLRQLVLGVLKPQPRLGPPMRGQLSLPQVAEGLRSLGATLTRLDLLDMFLDDEGWEALAASLPRLERLTLTCGSLTDAGLAAIGCHLPSLERLVVDPCCTNPLPSDSAWLGLAKARARPLKVAPPVSKELQAQCAAVQERQHGRSTLVWRPL